MGVTHLSRTGSVPLRSCVLYEFMLTLRFQEFVVEYPEDRHQLVVVTFLGLMKDYVELEKTKMEKAEEMKQQGLEPDMFEV